MDDLETTRFPTDCRTTETKWTFGKCDARHWVDVFARFAEYLRIRRIAERVNRVGGVTEGDRSRTI